MTKNRLTTAFFRGGVDTLGKSPKIFVVKTLGTELDMGQVHKWVGSGLDLSLHSGSVAF